jgi:hypothetical protein
VLYGIVARVCRKSATTSEAQVAAADSGEPIVGVSPPHGAIDLFCRLSRDIRCPAQDSDRQLLLNDAVEHGM